MRTPPCARCAWREQATALVTKHRGRLADFIGDNLLAEFPSARDAIACALEFQCVLAARNASLPEARPMYLRIGGHLGDVRYEDRRLFGDGVNVLQPLAESGGLCLSAALVEQVPGKIPLDLEDLGERVLKNLPNAVHVFWVRLENSAALGLAAARVPAPRVSAPHRARLWGWAGAVAHRRPRRVAQLVRRATK